MALTVAKSHPAGLHLYNTLTGEMITGRTERKVYSIIIGCGSVYR